MSNTEDCKKAIVEYVKSNYFKENADLLSVNNWKRIKKYNGNYHCGHAFDLVLGSGGLSYQSDPGIATIVREFTNTKFNNVIAIVHECKSDGEILEFSLEITGVDNIFNNSGVVTTGGLLSLLRTMVESDEYFGTGNMIELLCDLPFQNLPQTTVPIESLDEGEIAEPEEVDFENFYILELTDTYIKIHAGGDWQEPVIFKATLVNGELLCKKERQEDFDDNELYVEEILNIIYNNNIPEKVIGAYKAYNSYMWSKGDAEETDSEKIIDTNSMYYKAEIIAQRLGAACADNISQDVKKYINNNINKLSVEELIDVITKNTIPNISSSIEHSCSCQHNTNTNREFCIIWSDILGIEFIIAPNDVNTLRELELNGFVQITEDSMHYMYSAKEGKQKLIDLGFIENHTLYVSVKGVIILITDDNIDEYESKDKSIAEKLQSKENSAQESIPPDTELKNKIKAQFPTIEFTETVRHMGKVQVTGDIALGDRTITLYTYDAEAYNIFNITGGFAYDDINMLTKIINKCNIPIKKEGNK